ncbi:hypothetical protein UlMin_010304 [Ulmus minor]
MPIIFLSFGVTNIDSSTICVVVSNIIYSSKTYVWVIMIHRAILGSVERMFAILLEHYKGKWPFWLSPRQAIVCPVSEKSQSYAIEVRDQIHQVGYYADVDTKAQLAQYNYILVFGEEEAKTGQVSVRVRDKAYHSVMSIDGLLKHFVEEAAAFH